MWRALQITWRIAWRLLELVIVVYVLGAIHDPSASLIVGVLGLLYATIRSGFLIQAAMLMRIGLGVDQQFHELKRLWDPQAQAPDNEAIMGRFHVDVAIAGVFLTLVYVICLLHVFLKL